MGEADGFFVAGIGVADDSKSGVGGEDAFEAARRLVAAIGNDNHPGVE